MEGTHPPENDARIPVGVLGDSDSHSYHDSILLPAPHQRGGEYRSTTFQWTEIWERLRPAEVDLGEWGTWGTSRRAARIRRALWLPARAPRKVDYRYNLAFSGARCLHLVTTASRQVEPLLRLMDRDPQRWARGVVIIRIGINSIGGTDHLDSYAEDGVTPETRERILPCVEHIQDGVQQIREAHPTTRIVLIGIANDANWAKRLDRWQDPEALANIAQVLDLFDGALAGMARSDPYTAFMDDRAWFRRHWGGRDPDDGRPAYGSVSLGGPVPVTNTYGDHPSNVAVEDGHAGTVANGIWLSDLVKLIEEEWNLGLTPPRPDEVARLADPEGAYGLRPPTSPSP